MHHHFYFSEIPLYSTPQIVDRLAAISITFLAYAKRLTVVRIILTRKERVISYNHTLHVARNAPNNFW